MSKSMFFEVDENAALGFGAYSRQKPALAKAAQDWFKANKSDEQPILVFDGGRASGPGIPSLNFRPTVVLTKCVLYVFKSDLTKLFNEFPLESVKGTVSESDGFTILLSGEKKVRFYVSALSNVREVVDATIGLASLLNAGFVNIAPAQNTLIASVYYQGGTGVSLASNQECQICLDGHGLALLTPSEQFLFPASELESLQIESDSIIRLVFTNADLTFSFESDAPEQIDVVLAELSLKILGDKLSESSKARAATVEVTSADISLGNLSDSKFCGECGLARTPSGRFCGGCGQAF
jgi:hypothetical protein